MAVWLVTLWVAVERLNIDWTAVLARSGIASVCALAMRDCRSS